MVMDTTPYPKGGIGMFDASAANAVKVSSELLIDSGPLCSWLYSHSFARSRPGSYHLGDARHTRGAAPSIIRDPTLPPH